MQYSRDLSRLVRDWQKPLYNFAFRMLGNPADAADATQDIFAAVIKNLHRYDTHRPFKPWLYRVATNVLLNFIRETKLRRAKLEQLEKIMEPPEQRNILEDRERDEVLQRHLNSLSEESRSLLVLHYYHGLSQTEVADSMEPPRTTVQSRLQKALASLEKELHKTGYLAVIPSVELALQSTTPLAVPAEVSASLFSLAAQAGGTAATATGITLGGIMAKQTVITAAVIGLITLTAGIFIGNSLSGEKLAIKKPNSQNDPTKWADLQNQNQELKNKVAALKIQNEQLASAATRQKIMSVPAGNNPVADKGLDEVSATPANASVAKIDWQPFGKKFAGMVESVVGETEDDEDREPTPEEMEKMVAAMNEFMKVASQARKLGDNPFFHEDVFPGFAVALYGDSLGMTDNQKQSLLSASQSLLSKINADFNPEEALPVESFAARMNMIDGIQDAVQGMLTPEQKGRYNTLSKRAKGMLEGNSTQMDLGLKGDEAQSQIMKKWGKSFGLNDDQKAMAKDLVGDYMDKGRNLLESYNQLGENKTKLTDKRKQKLKLDFAKLQATTERQMLPWLTADQRANLARTTPTLFRFNEGDGASISMRRGPDF